MSRTINAPGNIRIRTKQRFGQNFLFSAPALESICAAAPVQRHTPVLEIGAGLGSLSVFLARHTDNLIVVEIDRTLIPRLRQALNAYPRARIINADILDCSLSELRGDGPALTVFGNLPFYITSPLLIHLLNHKQHLDTLVLMVQHEVAQRLAAAPGNRQYGRLSCLAQYHCQVEIIQQIPRRLFVPPPRVDAAVVRLIVRHTPAVATPSEKVFFSLIRAAFGHRRKTLLNSLRAETALLPPASSSAWPEILARSGISANCRAEELSLQEFSRLTDALLTHTAHP